jgi:hypothetical protein
MCSPVVTGVFGAWIGASMVSAKGTGEQEEKNSPD